MGADIRLIDQKGQDITDTAINFGKARLGFPTTKKVKVYNAGDKIAYNIELEALQHESSDSYKWKCFRMYEDSKAVKKINLGDLGPGKYLEGTKKEEIEFISDGILMEKWNTGGIIYDTKSIKFVKNTGDGSGISAARLEWNINNIKNIEVSFKIKLEVDKSFENYDSAILNFPLRMNSRKDHRGYCVSIQKRRKDGKIYIAFYKGGKGMVENLDRDYGTNLYNTGWIKFDESKDIKFKLYNNVHDQPCFQLFIDKKPISLKNTDDPTQKTMIVIDKDADTAYVGGGKAFLDYSIWNGDISLELSDFNLSHDIQEHEILLQTVVGNEAENNKLYSSYLNLSYEEDNNTLE